MDKESKENKVIEVTFSPVEARNNNNNNIAVEDMELVTLDESGEPKKEE